MIGLVIVFGLALFSTIAPLQIQVMSQAAAAPVLASSFNIAAFNLGNAGGAWLGGYALENGVSYQQLPLIGAAMCTVGLLLTFVSKPKTAIS
jgi:MFS transporter, DHA1 family, inner membrane transport protein